MLNATNNISKNFMIIQVIEKLRLFQSLKNEDVLTNFGLSNSLFILIVMARL